LGLKSSDLICHADLICHFVALTKAGQSFVTELEEILQRFDRDLRQAIKKAQAISR
jgi:hypothetical protein